MPKATLVLTLALMMAVASHVHAAALNQEEEAHA